MTLSEYLTQQNLSFISTSEGKELRIICPFCKHPKQKCYVHSISGLWYCFHCGEGGVFSTLQKALSLSGDVELRELKQQEQFELPPMDREDMERYHVDLWKHQEILDWLHNKRGYTDETIKKFKLGWDGKSVVTPIFDAKDNLVNLRFRRDPTIPSAKKSVWGIEGRNGARIFNEKVIHEERFDSIIIAEGEPDGILLDQMGFRAISSTGGGGNFNDEWIAELVDCKEIYVCMDSDDEGIGFANKHAPKIAKTLPNSKVFNVHIPQIYPLCKDVTDFIVAGKKSKEDFEKLLEEAAPLFPHNQPFPQPRLEISWPEPISEFAFYGIAGKIVKAIEPHTEADPVALLTNFLTSFGSVIGPNPHFEVEADKHPARLFVAQIGETSKGRKGTAWNYIQNLFSTVDPSWPNRIATGLSSGEGLIWAVRDPITKSQPVKEHNHVVGYESVIEDPGIEDKRLLVLESELASTLRVLPREGNTLSAIIRNAWDSRPLQTLTKNSQAKASVSHISIIGHITREELLRYLSDVEAANGFGNRFLWVCVKRSKCLPYGGQISQVDFAFSIREIQRCVEFSKTVDRIIWSEEAKPAWEHIYPRLSQGQPGLMGALTSRSEAYVTRLACIYALLDCSSVVTINHLKAALAIWEYSENSARYIFQRTTGDKLANEILEFLRTKPEGVTRTQVNDYFGGHKSSDQLLGSLSVLEKLGIIRKETGHTGGRAQEIWILVADAEKAEKVSKTSSYTLEIDKLYPPKGIAEKVLTDAEEALKPIEPNSNTNQETISFPQALNDELERRADEILGI